MVPVLNHIGVHAAAVGNHDCEPPCPLHLRTQLCGCKRRWWLCSAVALAAAAAAVAGVSPPPLRPPRPSRLQSTLGCPPCSST
jgi:hypothetical protein